MTTFLVSVLRALFGVIFAAGCIVILVFITRALHLDNFKGLAIALPGGWVSGMLLRKLYAYFDSLDKEENFDNFLNDKP